MRSQLKSWTPLPLTKRLFLLLLFHFTYWRIQIITGTTDNKKWKNMFPPGLEPGTFRVLGERDNHYTTETWRRPAILQNTTALLKSFLIMFNGAVTFKTVQSISCKSLDFFSLSLIGRAAKHTVFEFLGRLQKTRCGGGETTCRRFPKDPTKINQLRSKSWANMNCKNIIRFLEYFLADSSNSSEQKIEHRGRIFSGLVRRRENALCSAWDTN